MSEHGFWSKTKPHKHRYVRVTSGSLIHRLLRKHLITLDWTHRSYVYRSRLTWGVVDMGEAEPWGVKYVLTPLSLLHSLTGLTIRIT